MGHGTRHPTALDAEALEVHADEAARLLKVLASPPRLRVLCSLCSGELNVGQINEQLSDLSQSALSQHLARLRAERVVTTRREAQTIWYSLTPGPAERVIATLYEVFCPEVRRSKRRSSSARGTVRGAQ